MYVYCGGRDVFLCYVVSKSYMQMHYNLYVCDSHYYIVCLKEEKYPVVDITNINHRNEIYCVWTICILSVDYNADFLNSM